jgi:hypothetical protein
MFIPPLRVRHRDRVDGFPEYVVHCDVVGFQLPIDAVTICTQPCLDGGERELDRVEVGRICREVQQARAAFLDHFANAGNLVNRRVVDDEDGVWEWPFVHTWEQALHETLKVVAGDRLLEDLEMDNPIEG